MTSPENPNLITHVPGAEEFAANRPSENAIDFTDPEQLAAFNADLVSLGLPPREAPSPRTTPVRAEETAPAYSAEAPYVTPENERRLSGAEMDAIRRDMKIGKYAVDGALDTTENQ